MLNAKRSVASDIGDHQLDHEAGGGESGDGVRPLGELRPDSTSWSKPAR
jgi:hypothetical protein